MFTSYGTNGLTLAFSAALLYYINMYKILRIVFCSIAVACAAVTILVFALCGIWGLLPLGLGIVSAVLMLLCKGWQEKQELKANPPPAEGDFITGKVSNPELKSEE